MAQTDNNSSGNLPPSPRLHSAATTLQRVVIFSDHSTGIPELLVRNAVMKIAAIPNAEVVAVCVPSTQKYLRNLLVYGLKRISNFFKRLTGRHQPPSPSLPIPVSLARLARKHRFEVVVPPQGNINDPEFIALLASRYRPTTCLSLYCLQKFSPALLAAFKDTVNYHNGLLPQYRGLKATSWSIYNNEPETGFVFHRMNEEIDQGAILLQHSFTLEDDANAGIIEIRKALLSSEFLPAVFARLARQDPGLPQVGPGTYHSRSMMKAIARIEDPGLLHSDEIERRLRAFLALNIDFSGRTLRVTRLKQIASRGRSRKPVLQSADGKLFQVSRVDYLPYWLAVLRDFCRRLAA